MHWFQRYQLISIYFFFILTQKYGKCNMEIYFKFRPIKEHRLPCFACPLIATNASLLCMSAYCNKRCHALHVRLLQQTLPCSACLLIATNAAMLCMSAYCNKRFLALHVCLLQQTLPCLACLLIATNASLLIVIKTVKLKLKFPLHFP